MFRVGQKVVCVDATNHKGRSWGGDAPTVGAVYTVVGFEQHDKGQAVILAEIKNRYGGGFMGYLARRFRPLVDISDLTELVAEVFQGKKREIPADDQFDRNRVHSAAHPVARAAKDAASPGVKPAGELCSRQPAPSTPTASGDDCGADPVTAELERLRASSRPTRTCLPSNSPAEVV